MCSRPRRYSFLLRVHPEVPARAVAFGMDTGVPACDCYRPKSTHTRLPEDFPNGEPSSSGTFTGMKRVEGDAYQTRRRPSLYGCRLDRTVRASIRVIHVRRAVSGPTHQCTARAGVRQKRPRSRAVACLPFPLERAVRTMEPCHRQGVGLTGMRSSKHLSRRHTTAGHPRLCSETQV
jgi:hypothetical protein